MTRAHPRSRAGFTLVELMIGATLSAAIMAAVLSSYLFMGRNLARLTNQQALQGESRRTLAYFNRDVRMASGLSGTISATAVTFILPTSTGTTTVAYSYDSGAGTLTRTPASGTTLTLLRNITTDGLTFRFYDTSANEYTADTLIAGSYLTSIKQISLEFSTQTGSNANGTQTPVHQVASNRLIIRNRSLLQ